MFMTRTSKRRAPLSVFIIERLLRNTGCSISEFISQTGELHACPQPFKTVTIELDGKGGFMRQILPLLVEQFVRVEVLSHKRQSLGLPESHHLLNATL